MLVLRREPAHRGEAREDQRDDARLGAAGEHRVGVAALDHLGRLADRVRAGRAGRDDRVVRAFDPERDRELARDGVDEHVRQEVRRDAARARGRGASPPARRCPARRRSPSRRRSRRASGRTRSGRRPSSASRPAATPSSTLRSSFRASFGRDDLARVEALHLGGDPHRQAVGVERRDPVDAALAGERRAPGRRRIEPERGDGPDAGDGDALHRRQPYVTFARSRKRKGRCPWSSTIKPGLVFFHSQTSGKCRRIEGYIAQVLQRRRNHETFKYYAVASEERPDLIDRFGIAVMPTLARRRGEDVSARGSRSLAAAATSSGSWRPGCAERRRVGQSFQKMK